MDVYVTRDSYSYCVQVWPHGVGIRKFPGCEEYGAAWCQDGPANELSPKGQKRAKTLRASECRERFGFWPKEAGAWLIKGRHHKRTKIDLAFSP